ncbi:Chemotaxis protein histidine kinase and related kinases [Lawsonia intracellularis PHE/MN1-00]|uniref:Chemotaxis protein CheA n=1 Tax=Lawsonia intracellularis (strain PHE/MN1-00) TaxID=363253 RepID=Q1MP79_LAWIP|nr:Chemotaxis protein histidine kinase and related kinases [Lawsonia intracellularis PHE/MN1-00]
MKGNSGIIGFHELNSLTHEAETLLNRVRHGEMVATHELIDLLLLVVDVIDSLVERIESSTGIVQPFDISEILVCLQSAVAGKDITLPKALIGSLNTVDSLEQNSIEHGVETIENQVSQTSTESSSAFNSSDKENEIAFAVTVKQQQSTIHAALEALAQDSSQREYIDALYRSLISIQNAAGVMGYDELKVYAERTAGLVAQGRDSGIDFSLMLDILTQEVAIVDDMIAVILAGDGITQLSSSPIEQKEVLSSQDGNTTDTVSSTPVVSAEHLTSLKSSSLSTQESPGQIESHVPSKPGPVLKTISNVPKNIKPPSVKSSQAKPANANDATSEQKSSSTIRVDHEKLDHLMNLIGELIINRNRYTMLARRLEEQGTNADVVEVAQDLSETTYAMARISDELQDTIMKVRMVPVASVFSRFPRLVRDLSRKSGKEVDLVLEGEETELDKSVVEVIGDPLVHLIRNAVDHGIEPESERIAQGKSTKGKVTLRAYHKGNSVAIEIEDDGKGLDPDKLREVAIKKGILSAEEAKLLDDREAMELIFAPGFSSAEKITDISGRGVGMDVVRTNIKNLKGSISIFSEIGKGTRFTLSLPLTLAIIDALMVNVAGEVFAIPLDAVSETTKLEASKLNDINGRKAVTLRGEVLGLIELSELLNLPQEEHTDVLSVVIIHSNERRLGLVVNKLLERQEIVIKPLGSYLGDIPCISGATIMGDGGVILILDPHEIYLLSTSAAKSVSQ